MAALFRNAARVYRLHWKATLLVALLLLLHFRLVDRSEILFARSWGRFARSLLFALWLYPLRIGCLWVLARLMRGLPVTAATALSAYTAPGAAIRLLFPWAIAYLPWICLGAAIHVLDWRLAGGLPDSLVTVLKAVLPALSLALFVAGIVLYLLPFLLLLYPGKPLRWLLAQSAYRLSGNVGALLLLVALSGFGWVCAMLVLDLLAWLPAIICILPAALALSYFYLVLMGLVANCVTVPCRRPRRESAHNRTYRYRASTTARGAAH